MAWSIARGRTNKCPPRNFQGSTRPDKWHCSGKVWVFGVGFPFVCVFVFLVVSYHL